MQGIRHFDFAESNGIIDIRDAAYLCFVSCFNLIIKSIIFCKTGSSSMKVRYTPLPPNFVTETSTNAI